MQVERYIPSPALRPYVKHFMIIESDSNGMENRILPDTSVTVAFRLSGQTAFGGDKKSEPLSIATISGLRKTARLISYAGNTAMLLVVFHEAAAAAFFKEPLFELYDQSISLDNIIPPQQIKDIEEQLTGARTNRQCISLAEQFFLSRLTTNHDPLIQHAVQQIKATNGAIRVKELLTILPISRDPFEKRFRKVTGTSPKQFANIIRLRHLIDTFPGTRNFTDAAYNAGYFDQAHFIKDFRLFTGQAPHDFFASANWW